MRLHSPGLQTAPCTFHAHDMQVAELRDKYSKMLRGTHPIDASGAVDAKVQVMADSNDVHMKVGRNTGLNASSVKVCGYVLTTAPYTYAS